MASMSTGKSKHQPSELDIPTEDEDDSEDKDKDEDVLDWCAYANTFDVCITTYNVLQHDLSVARAPLTRPRREVAAYSKIERPRSPLVMCEWYRVIMDEVQMVGGGKTEHVFSSTFRFCRVDADGAY
jgi:E3 ubiquitin-protein ligase SHPRH